MEWNLLNFIIYNDVLIARALIAFLLFFVFLLFFLFFASRLVSFRFICTGVDDEVLYEHDIILDTPSININDVNDVAVHENDVMSDTSLIHIDDEARL